MGSCGAPPEMDIPTERQHPMAKGNGKAPAQEALIPGLEDEAPTEEAAQADDAPPEDVHAAAAAEPAEVAPARPEVRVLELVNATDGCWMVVEGGTRIELSDGEWRKELAHLFRKEAPARHA